VKILITGGAGFIGTNVADRLLQDGAEVRILDSLSRLGTEDNLNWLRREHPSRLEARIGDVRDRELVMRCVCDVDHVVHLAAQVAVTSSLGDPRHDFEVNAGGTVNVLEAIRVAERKPSLVFCSTNKVYGALPDVGLTTTPQRYQPADACLRSRGIDETRPLDFHSPYGCSKGAADQYVLDYARSFGLRAIVLRMSCIYGPHQHGNEDQGWVAHFMRCAIDASPVTIYGDGKQVRDILFVDDLVDALECARAQIDTLQGRAFNMGGGPANTISVLELLDHIERINGARLPVRYAAWRVGDQRLYVSCTQSFTAATGWTASTDVDLGLARLHDWLQQNTGQRGTARLPPCRDAQSAVPVRAAS
jgi:CDP-paratose 2-epimerase